MAREGGFWVRKYMKQINKKKYLILTSSGWFPQHLYVTQLLHNLEPEILNKTCESKIFSESLRILSKYIIN